MNESVNRNNVLVSLFWKFMEQGSAQGIQLIVQIVLARMLLPEFYGVIALVTVFISIANVFIQSGLNSALVQKKVVDEADYSSVFYLSLILSAFVYLLFFVSAPMIAKFYKMPEIVAVFRVLSIRLLFGSVTSIQNAVVYRNLQFKKVFISSTGSLLVSGAVGIYLAYAGYGVWALVWQQIVSQIMITIIQWYIVKWRPKLIFSFKQVKTLFSFGWKLLVSALIDTVYLNFRSLVIGKLYTPSVLGHYNKGKEFPSLIVQNIDGSLQSVLFPVLASQQDDKQKVKKVMRRSIATSSFLIFPMMIGLAVIAEPLVIVLLTDKWRPAVPFLQISCITYLLMPMHTANLQAIKGLGHSDIFLRLEIIKKIIGVIILFVTIYFGVYAIAIGGVISSFVSLYINTYPNKKLLDYTYAEQWRDVKDPMLISLLMGAIVYGFIWIGLSSIITLVIQVISGILIYIGLSWFFKVESFTYLLMSFSELLTQKRQNQNL